MIKLNANHLKVTELMQVSGADAIVDDAKQISSGCAPELPKQARQASSPAFRQPLARPCCLCPEDFKRMPPAAFRFFCTSSKTRAGAPHEALGIMQVPQVLLRPLSSLLDDEASGKISVADVQAYLSRFVAYCTIYTHALLQSNDCVQETEVE